MALAKKQADELTPEARVERATRAILSRVEELQALRVELNAAEAAVREAGGTFAVVKPSYTAGLWFALDNLQCQWKLHRRDLTGGPEPPTTLEVAITEARADVADARAMLAKYQTMLQKPGGSKDSALLRIATSWIDQLKARQSRLASLLASGPQSRAILDERLALAESSEPTITLTV